jgi:hypothetical protein
MVDGPTRSKCVSDIGADDDFTQDENQAFVVGESLLSLYPLCFGAPLDKETCSHSTTRPDTSSMGS